MDLVVDGTARPVLYAPSYMLERRLGGTRLTIHYRLEPQAQGGHGVLVLEQGRDGWLRLVSRQTRDPRTGSAVVRFAEKDVFTTLFDVGRCAD